MKIAILSALSICLSVNSVASAQQEKAEAKKIKTADVEITKDLTLKVPATWIKDDKPNSMRKATYFVPAAEGDQDRGELSISSFPGGGGSVDQNIQRWIGQFSGKGKTAKVTKGKANGNEYYLVELTGTFGKSVGPPILRKTEPAEGYRMYGTILILEGKGVYFLKLTGPDATVKAQEKLYRQSFGAKKSVETDYEM